MDFGNYKTVNTEITVPVDRKKLLYAELDRLQKAWEEKTKVEIPEATTYERKEFLDVDREGITKQVEAENAYKLITGIEAKRNQYRENVRANEYSQNKIKNGLKDKEVEITAETEQSKKDFSNDAVKQGIARSSIVSNEKARLDSVGEEAIKEARAESEDRIKNLELEKAILTDDLESDLNKLKLSHAHSVQTRIAEIIESIDKENKKILEYNNEMEILENKAAQKRAEVQQKYYETLREEAIDEAKNGYKGAKRENYDERFNLAKNYYTLFSKEQALKEFEQDTEMVAYLGRYYDRLKSYLMQR